MGGEKIEYWPRCCKHEVRILYKWITPLGFRKCLRRRSRRKGRTGSRTTDSLAGRKPGDSDAGSCRYNNVTLCSIAWGRRGYPPWSLRRGTPAPSSSVIRQILFSERMTLFNLHLFGRIDSEWDRVYGTDGGSMSGLPIIHIRRHDR